MRDARETWSSAAAPLLTAFGQAVLQREAIDERIASLRAQIKALDTTLALATTLGEAPTP